MLYADDRIRIACALAEQRGRFLFEVRPDAFPCGRLTDLEEQVWSLYYDERRRERKG